MHVVMAGQLCEYTKNLGLNTLHMCIVWFVDYSSIKILQEVKRVRKNLSFF